MKDERKGDAAEPDAKSLPGGRKRLLIVDDDEGFRIVFAQMLTHAGFEVSVAPSGFDGLRFFRERGTADAVLLDYRMPGMNGVDTFRQLRAEGVRVPIVLVSAIAEIAEVAAREGFSGILSKPFGAEELDNLLQSISAIGL